MDSWDVVVIGAGIQGVAIAEQAARSGYRCLIVEQYAEPAMATSSRSSKLIHGGLRYLESGQFRLVYECLRERRRLLREYPELVRLVPFHIPVYTDTGRSSSFIHAGLLLYRLLGGGPFERVSAERFGTLDGLRREGLKSVFRYRDGQTDDAALTRAVLDKALGAGAGIWSSTRFISASRREQDLSVTVERDRQERTIRTRMLVNAAGPWANQVLGAIHPAPAAVDIELVAGTHILVPGRLHQGMYYLESPRDGRAVFVMPWKENVMIGTTETPFTGDPAGVKPTDAEIEYLLETYWHYFAGQERNGDVLEAFAGLRVLPGGSGRPFERSRDAILQLEGHLLTVCGGKLTTHGVTARQCLAHVRRVLGAARPERR